MKTIDHGHTYELDTLDGGVGQILQFVKRIGAKYPGNKAPAHPGTTTQEVLRALIDRSGYVNAQKPNAETEAVINLLRTALFLLEVRALRKKGRYLDCPSIGGFEHHPTSSNDGHVV